MAKFLIVANWKANSPKTYNFELEDRIEVAIAAPYSQISSIPSQFSRVSQDVSMYPIGAYTGEMPAQLLVDLGVKYCLVGHSERRKYLKETNIEAEAKMSQAMQNGITPILCAQTLEEIPENIRNFSGDEYLIMYEPFSAISTKGQYRPEEVEKVATVITDWKNKLNLQCRFLYGGSVNPEYVQQLVTSNQQLISGLVVGHASLDAETFFSIIKKCLQNLP